jgi:hypothetical protein
MQRTGTFALYFLLHHSLEDGTACEMLHLSSETGAGNLPRRAGKNANDAQTVVNALAALLE